MIVWSHNSAKLVADISAQKDTIISEKDEQITTLEDELARVWAEIEAEATMKPLRWEKETDRSLLNVRNIRAQLGNIMNLVQDQLVMCEEKKALMDVRWEQKEARCEDKNAQMIELHDMVQKIHNDMEHDRSKCEDLHRNSQEGQCF